MMARENVDGLPDQGSAEPTMGERLAYYLTVLRRRWRVIALFPAVALVVSIAIGLQAEKKYDATAKVVVSPSNQVSALLNPSSATPSSDPERDLNTEVSRIKTVPLAEAVRRRLRLRESDKDLLAQVTTAIEGTTNIVDITVRDPDPTRAAAVANSFAIRYVAARQTDAQSAFQQAAAQARSQLASLSPTDRSGAQGLRLASRLHELEVDSTLQTGNAQVIQSATTPTSAATPKVLFDSTLAAFLGLILGLVAAAVLELLDRRVKDEDDVSRITRLPVLASIPHPRRALRSRPLEPGQEQTEGYRSLATNLRFFNVGGKVKVLMITSPSPLAGKTTVTLSLAAALAEFGQKVIAVECDLRRPRFDDYLGLGHPAGLSSILAGMASWSQEVVEIDVGYWRAGVATAQGEAVHFSVLPGGPSPPNPHALLSSSEMNELMLELRSSADVLLIDTPPLGPLTDAVPLIPWVDGVALVVRLEHTTRDEVQKACTVLTEFDAPMLGTVLTGSRPSLGGYYGADGSPRRAAGPQVESRNGRAQSRRTSRTPRSRA